MVAAGTLLAVQARVNGALAARIGSAVIAALLAYAVAAGSLLVLVVGSRGWRGAVDRLSAGRVRWPWWLGGLAGAAVVATTAAGVPRIGVALVSVALVAGATAGGLLVDWAGWGSSGPQRPSASRVLGAGLAIAAVGLGALGQRAGKGDPLLVVLVMVAGFASAGQQAASGQLALVMGDVRVAALVSSVVAAVSLAGWTALLALASRLSQLTWPTTWWLYLGGLAVALYGVIAAATVRRLGVLVVSVASVCGQLLGGVAFDVATPPPGGLRVSTILGALTTLLAVAVAAHGGRQGRRGNHHTRTGHN